MRKLVVIPTAAPGLITTASGSSLCEILVQQAPAGTAAYRKPLLEALARAADIPKLILVEEDATLIEGADRSPQTTRERIHLF